MNDIFVAILLLAFGGSMYGLGRAHRPRRDWEEGYRKGYESIFKVAVRATAARANSSPGRFRPRFPAFGRATATAAVPNPASSLYDDTTVDLRGQVPAGVLQFRPRGPVDPDADTEVA